MPLKHSLVYNHPDRGSVSRSLERASRHLLLQHGLLVSNGRHNQITLLSRWSVMISWASRRSCGSLPYSNSALAMSMAPW
jgi:hypothetical protein